MSGKKPKANDYLSLIFSDMVYEDFYNGKKADGGDENSTIEEIFFNSAENRFKDDPKYRKNRLEVNYTNYDQLSNWKFLMKDGENNLERKEEPNNLFYKIKSVIMNFVMGQAGPMIDAGTDPDVLSLVIKQVPLLPVLAKLNKAAISFNLTNWALVNQLEDLVYSKIDKFLEGDLGAGDGFYAAAFVNEGDKEIIIAYRGTNETRDHTMTNSLIAAGIPSEQFDKAENFYKLILKDHSEYKNYSFTFTGHSLAGGLAQYAAVMAQGNGHHVYCKTWNGIGIKHFKNFYGNEFLGYKDALLFLVNKVLIGERDLRDELDKRVYQEIQKSDIIQGTSINSKFVKKNEAGIPEIDRIKFIRELVKHRLDMIDEAADKVKKFKQEIKAIEERMEAGDYNQFTYQMELNNDLNKKSLLQGKIDNLKDELLSEGYQQFEDISDTDQFTEQLLALQKDYKQALIEDSLIKESGLSLIMPIEEAEELEEIAFELANRKLRFAEKYKKLDKSNLQNYANSYDITGTIFKHVGNCYLVDKEFKDNSEIKYSDLIEEGSLKDGAGEIGGEELELAKQHGVNIFYPYILLEKKGNIGEPENYKGGTAEIGELTDSLSYDYLRSIIKYIILEITDDGNDLKELEELYLKYKSASRKKTEETFQDNLFKLSKATLFNSVKQQGRKLDEVTKNNINQDLNEEWITIEESSLLKILITIYNECKYTIVIDENNSEYSLDTAILAQLKKIDEQDRKKLWRWSSSGNIKQLFLGTAGVTQEEETIYHSTPITNSSQQIKMNITAPPNRHNLFGSSKLEENSKSQRDPFEFVMGMGQIDTYNQDSDPQTDIIINEVQLGKKIEIQEEYLNNLKEDEDKYYGTEIYEEVFAEQDFKVEYHLQPNFSQPEENVLIAYYGPSATKDGVTEFTTEKLNRTRIDEFVNGDYGIYLPRVHRVEGSLEAEIVDDGIRELQYYEIYAHRQQENSKISGDGLKIALPNGEQKLLGQDLEFKNEVELIENKLKYEFTDKFGFYYAYIPEESTVEVNYSYGASFGNNKQYFSKYGGKVIIDNYQYGDFGLEFIVPEDVLYGSRRRYDLEDEVVNYATVLYGSRNLVVQLDRSNCEYKFTAGSSGFWQHNNTVEEESNGSGKILLKFGKQDYRDAASLLSKTEVAKDTQKNVCLNGDKITFTYLKELGNLVINFGDYNNALLINGFENGDYGLNHAKFKFQDNRGQSPDQYIFYNGESTPTYKREDEGTSSFNGVVMESDGSGKILLKLFGQLHNLAELNFKQLPKLKRIANSDGNTYGIKTFYEVKVKKYKTATLYCEYSQNCYDDKYDLVIKYGSNQQWKIMIKKFRNGDYGIKLPLNRIDEIAGANSKFNRKERDKLICYA
ncbi:DUF2974 domain-containing protein [Halanaerobacter jeridensis]|uniref:Fungal lipase-like domain-containing protein n=1 Tax=Halanaerobacter jeridensis TaxID=706427 RepID=A0A939BP03_9FIRM|nr:DUF2974 domain-containing protein [Halanaerobacter jeridensis]MBM7556327.1 hypothetical protein [Halanaerobacter jeridensis]